MPLTHCPLLTRRMNGVGESQGRKPSGLSPSLWVAGVGGGVALRSQGPLPDAISIWGQGFVYRGGSVLPSHQSYQLER